jgi:hypothetical protein
MKLWQNILGNLAGIGLQVAAQSLSLIPPKYAILGAIGQAVIATVAHFYNTNGTPQSVPGPK